MGWEAWATLATVALILLVLAKNWAGADMAFLAGVVVLLTLGLFSDGKLPGPREVAGLFGNEGLLTVGALFVVAAGLTETGALNLVTERLLGRPASMVSAQLRLMLPVTAFSAFLNNTPVVAMFTPVVHDWTKRSGLSPSKLFMPLSYAAILGGTCTLVGTSTNLVVRGLMVETQATDPDMPVLGFWTIGVVGVPVAVLGTAYVLLLSRRLLPDRKGAMEELADPRQYTVEMRVEPGSPLDGQTIEAAGLRHLPGMYLMEIERPPPPGAPPDAAGERLVAVGPQQRLAGNDRLIFVGVVESVKDLQRFRGLVPATDQVFKLTDPRPSRLLVEAVVGPACPVVNKTIRDGRFRTRYDAVVIAVYRDGHRIAGKIGDIVLQAGDALLLETHPRFITQYRNSRDFVLVSGVADSQPPRHERAWVALVILAGMVGAMTLESVGPWLGGRVSIFHVALAAAALMVLTCCCSGEQARRSIDWSTLVAIGASFAVGRALETSGAAAAVAETVFGAFRGLGPQGVLAGVYLVTLLFTELVTNNAAAALAFPVAHAASTALDVNFMPFAIAIAVASSAGFAVPAGYATHMMVNGPGGYRFGDWLRFGVPLDLLVMAATVALAPLAFPFHPAASQ